MDPTSNLERQLRIARRVASDEEVDQVDCAELAELVIGLDRWIKAGGFLPNSWSNSPEGRYAGVLKQVANDLRFPLGQLRHLYKNMLAKNMLGTGEIAKYLIEPCIERLEGVLAAIELSGVFK